MAADPECPQCGGTGWKQVQRGDVQAVERCGCVSVGRSVSLFERAGIPERFQDATFGTFIPPDAENPIAGKILVTAMLTARTFAREYPLCEDRGLLFQGPTGAGKTHLAAATLRGLLEKGIEGVFFDYQNLLDRIRKSYDPAAGTSDKQAYETALETEVVLLDDLGSHSNVSPWVMDTITAIVNYRYNARKPLIVTTNLAIAEMGEGGKEREALTGEFRPRETLSDRIGARAVSRLLEMCRLVRMESEDFRVRSQLRRRQ